MGLLSGVSLCFEVSHWQTKVKWEYMYNSISEVLLKLALLKKLAG